MGKLKILVVEPNKAPYKSEIADDYKEMQKIVGGLIEAVYAFSDNAILFCNDEGKLIGLEGNRHVGQHIIAGTFFIVGDDGQGGSVSLTDEQLQKYSEQFEQTEEIQLEEVQEDCYMEFIGFD